MRSLSRPFVTSFIWLVVPTLIWSLFVQSFVLCIDSLILPAIEKRLPRYGALVLRWLWVVAFAIILMAGWNIGPDTYMFYLREALPYTPKIILAELGCTLVVLIWFATKGNIAQSLGRWHANVLAGYSWR